MDGVCLKRDQAQKYKIRFFIDKGAKKAAKLMMKLHGYA